MRIGLPIISLSFFVFSSCNMIQSKKSSEVPQEDILTTYTIEFDEFEKSGTASATFSGKVKMFTQFVLDKRSKVLYNNASMDLRQMPIIGGHFYEKKINKYNPKHIFVYADNDGKMYTTKMMLLPIKIQEKNMIPDENGAVSFTISRAIHADEIVNLTLTGDADLESDSFQLDEYNGKANYDTLSNKITLFARAFKNFPTSMDVDVILSVEKSNDTIEESPSNEGSIKVTYNSKAVIFLKNN